MVDEVASRVTSGRHVDAIATDVGICVNPRRTDLVSMLEAAGSPLLDFQELRAMAAARASRVSAPDEGRNLRAIVEDRHGDPTDVILG